jgi:hypothetical protein
VNGALFVPDEEMAEILLVQLVVDRKHNPAGIAEDDVHVFPAKRSQQYLGSSQFHNVPPAN